MSGIADNINKQSNLKVLPARLWLRLYLTVASLRHASLFNVPRASCPRNELNAGRMPTTRFNAGGTPTTRFNAGGTHAILNWDSIPEDVSGLSIITYINNSIMKIKKNLLATEVTEYTEKKEFEKWIAAKNMRSNGV